MLEITSDLVNDFSDEKMICTLKERELILQEIEKRERVFGPGKKEYKAGESLLSDEIRAIISELIFVDSIVKENIKKRMVDIRKEMNGLYSSSRAVNAYATQRTR